jgi:hypothetical protein
MMKNAGRRSVTNCEWRIPNKEQDGGKEMRTKNVYCYDSLAGGMGMTTKRNEFLKNTWRLQPELEVSDLLPPVVLFSLFDADPRVKFSELLRSASEETRLPDARLTAGLDPELLRHGRLTTLWDSLFREVPGDRLGLIYQNRPNGRSRASKKRKARAAAVTVGTLLASDNPPGEKWLVTRATLYHQKSVCWCLPVTVATGETKKVKLTPKNLMDLDLD